MLQTIKNLLRDEHIELSAALPLSATRITRPYLLERCGISDGSVVCFAIPYYTEPDGATNLSAYAYAEDYHLFVRELGARLCARLAALYPGNRFAVFADHSPIDERHAAAAVGLGVIGRHGMLITEPYSSYVFLGELITDAVLEDESEEIKYCRNCGACATACPFELKDNCLSALTQKKGELSAEEQELIRLHGSVWGCDKCTEACPHTHMARNRGTLTSPIPFFSQERITHLTPSVLDAMDDQTFSRRAYSWRGRETIKRNVCILGECDGAGKASDKAASPPYKSADKTK